MSEIKIGDTEINLNVIFRYVYGGVLIFFLWNCIFPDEICKFTEKYKNLGELTSGTFLVILIITLATGFYAIYKTLISECYIDDQIHLRNPRAMGGHEQHACALHYLSTFHVNVERLITAYRLIRDAFFERDVERMFYKRHSEIHILYQTSTIFLFGGCAPLLFKFFLPFEQEFYSFGYLAFFCLLMILAYIFFKAGLIADKKLCEDERAYLQSLNPRDIELKLREAGLIANVVSDSLPPKANTPPNPELASDSSAYFSKSKIIQNYLRMFLVRKDELIELITCLGGFFIILLISIKVLINNSVNWPFFIFVCTVIIAIRGIMEISSDNRLNKRLMKLFLDIYGLAIIIPLCMALLLPKILAAPLEDHIKMNYKQIVNEGHLLYDQMYQSSDLEKPEFPPRKEQMEELCKTLFVNGIVPVSFRDSEGLFHQATWFDYLNKHVSKIHRSVDNLIPVFFAMDQQETKLLMHIKYRNFVPTWEGHSYMYSGLKMLPSQDLLPYTNDLYDYFQSIEQLSKYSGMGNKQDK